MCTRDVHADNYETYTDIQDISKLLIRLDFVYVQQVTCVLIIFMTSGHSNHTPSCGKTVE